MGIEPVNGEMAEKKWSRGGWDGVLFRCSSSLKQVVLLKQQLKRWNL